MHRAKKTKINTTRELTVDELVAILRYSQLPTLVVEDPGDVCLYSWWVERHLFGNYKVDVLASGGKANLLRIYERNGEFAHVPVVFVANRGMWLFTRIPKHYKNIIWTQGYSVDNDLYSGACQTSVVANKEKIGHRVRSNLSSMGGLENLLEPNSAYWKVLESIIRWFAFEVEKFRNRVEKSIEMNKKGSPVVVRKEEWQVQEHVLNTAKDKVFRSEIFPKVNSGLNKIIPEGETELDTDFCRHRGFQYPKSETIEEIRQAYRFKLPGKFLFEMLERFSGIPLPGLYNVALVNYESAPSSQRLIMEITRKLEEQRFVFS